MKQSLSQTCHQFFITLRNPTRLAILELLQKEKLNVGEICNKLNLERSMIAHNLQRLLRCNFVNVERKGKTRVYSLNEGVEKIFNVFETHSQNYCPNKGQCLLEE